MEDPRLAIAVGMVVLASPGHEKEALEHLINVPPTDTQMKRITASGLSIEGIRKYAQIALDEWNKP